MAMVEEFLGAHDASRRELCELVPLDVLFLLSWSSHVCISCPPCDVECDCCVAEPLASAEFENSSQEFANVSASLHRFLSLCVAFRFRV
jgi:hypothetical protein